MKISSFHVNSSFPFLHIQTSFNTGLENLHKFMDKVILLASPGLALIHTPLRSLICSPVLSSILISVIGYKAGAIIVVKPTAPILLSGLTKIKKILIVKYSYSPYCHI